MKICLVAIAVGCAKCPIVNVCPAKSVIGDWKEPEAGKGKDAEPKAGATKDRRKT